MNVMVVCGDDYRIYDSVVKARKWGKVAAEHFHESADIYRMNRDGSMGELYDFVEYEVA